MAREKVLFAGMLQWLVTSSQTISSACSSTTLTCQAIRGQDVWAGNTYTHLCCTEIHYHKVLHITPHIWNVDGSNFKLHISKYIRLRCCGKIVQKFYIHWYASFLQWSPEALPPCPLHQPMQLCWSPSVSTWSRMPFLHLPALIPQRTIYRIVPSPWGALSNAYNDVTLLSKHNPKVNHSLKNDTFWKVSMCEPACAQKKTMTQLPWTA